MAVVGTVVLAGTMVTAWRPVDMAAFGAVVLATLIQTAGLFCIAAAMQHGEASALAPWQFSCLLWALLLDAVMFGAPPGGAALAGSLLILVGGLLTQRLDRPIRQRT